MADYRLEGLSTRDFEHLSQSLALGVFGTGLIPFGDGRDGGREATFHGQVPGPTPDTVWDGYGVLQCKFRQRPEDDDEKDAVWAVKELEKDLKKFLDPQRKLPRPKYYVFITNVKLSAVAEVGGKDKVVNLLEEYKPQIGLEGFDVWDYDKLCRLLDSDKDVRIAYAAFITTGDILELLRQKLTEQSNDFWKIIPRYLQEEFHNELWARLEYAGQAAEHRVALANVFVDLPFGPSPQTEPIAELESRLRPGIIATLLGLGGERLKPSLLQKQEESGESNNLFRYGIEQNPNLGRSVLIGGPGQGKSTAGQFLCQLYRAAFLSGVPSHQVLPEYSEDLNVFQQQCQGSQIELPAARRFPVRIELDRFATQLAKGEVNSILDAIRQRINKLTDSDCTKNDLRNWMQSYSWAIVFDGLDEVPASSNRAEVMEAIQQFRGEIHTLDADVLIVATTRPQGYENEFSPRHYEHFYLWPLSPARALHYGERLAKARYLNEKDNYDLVTARLKMATEQAATARLMRSPLQITIMATLVLSGQPPHERWNLFKNYFEVVYKREIERNIPTSLILRERKADVTAIHQWCGLRLQRDGEREGKTDSLLSSEVLAELIRGYNQAEGCAEEEIEERTNQILQATTDRLVFLSPLQQDGVGFEIRSLQEFMAADALMEGNDDEIERRLEFIAIAPYWRNVFLFAAGKCFADQRARRSTIVALCQRLNLLSTEDESNDPLASLALAGSRLALDILEEEMARDKFRIQLVDTALNLLQLPDVRANARLASLYEPNVAVLFRQKVETQLKQPDFSARIGAWVVLKILCARNVDWAEELTDHYWPESPQEGLQIFGLYGSRIPVAWASKRLSPLVLENEPCDVFSMLEHDEEFEAISGSGLPCGKLAERSGLVPWLKSILITSQYKPDHDRNIEAIALRTPATEDDEWAEDDDRFHLEVGCLETTPEFIKEWQHIPAEAQKWRFYRAAGNLAANLNAENLAAQLRAVAQDGENEHLQMPLSSQLFPWPFLACINNVRSELGLLSLAQKAEEGKLGTLEDWNKAEDRWHNQGYTQDDHRYLTAENCPFDEHIGTVGFPLQACSIMSTNTDVELHGPFLRSKWQTAPSGVSRQFWAERYNAFFKPFLWRRTHKESNPLFELTPEDTRISLKEACNSERNIWFDLDNLPILMGPLSDESWMEFLVWLSQAPLNFRVGRMVWDEAPNVARYFSDHPEKVKLLRLLGCLAISGSSVPVDGKLISHDVLKARMEADGVEEEQHSVFYGSFWIRLSHATLESLEEIDKLAQECVDLDMAEYEVSSKAFNSSNIVELSLSLLQNKRVKPEQEERFVLALIRYMRESRYDQEAKLTGTLNRLLMRRQSRLNEPAVWQSLGLPDF